MLIINEEGEFSWRDWRDYALSLIWSPLLIAQIVLVLVLSYVNESVNYIIFWTGWSIWLISVIFAILPMIVLKRRGGVNKGDSYVKTTRLVDTGIYAVVRHPQYTAGLLFSLALMLISQTILVTLLGIFIIILIYLDIYNADKYGIEKFGEKYRDYMDEVPRTNFILGIIRYIFRKKKQKENHYQNTK